MPAEWRYLYEKAVANGKTVWKKIKTLEGPGGRALDKFGGAVAIDGRTIVIGADNHDLKGRNSNEGSAYVFSLPTNAAAGAVAGAVAARASGRSDVTTFIRLSLGARKNGYTKDKADGNDSGSVRLVLLTQGRRNFSRERLILSTAANLLQ